jgi:hypothetical protein
MVTLAALLVPATSAHAQGAWDAAYVGQSAQSVVLEAGETTTTWFEYRNVNASGGAWESSDSAVGPVRLGTQNPQDRPSAFAHASWIQTSRPTRLGQARVAHNEVGRFTFIAQAPPVPFEATFAETFAPVAEAVTWMLDEPATITYVVRPRVPPTVAITSASDRVPMGAPVTAVAAAADNVGVARVEFSLGGQAPVTATEAPYEVQIPTTGLPPGEHALSVRAVDRAGQSTSATRAVVVEALPNGAGAARDAKLTAGFGRRLTARHTVDYGRPDRVRGRLTTAAGAPIAGAALQVSTRVILPRRGFRRLTTVTTDANGNYSYLAPRGPSRQIRVEYTPFSGDPAPAATRVVRMSTRAGIRLTARKRGDLVRFSGRLRGGPKPSRGLIVVLQGEQPGYGWRTFRTARIGTGGRFTTSYRFRTDASGRFRFRATLREQIGYAYATGRSRVLQIRR